MDPKTQSPHRQGNEERTGILQPKLYGAVALVLIFIAAAVFTFEYLRQAPAAAQSQQQAIASTTPSYPDPYATTTLLAQGAIVIDLKTDRILFSLNPDTPRPLASITKVAMALVVSQTIATDTSITIPYTTAPSGAAERLVQGQVYTMQNLMDFTLAASNNDGADFLSEAANTAVHQEFPQSPLTSATSSTVWRMNSLTHELGLSTMQFYNDNGLDINTTLSGAYGSPRDVAEMLAYAASSSSDVFVYTTKQNFTVPAENGGSATAYNTDLALAAIPAMIMGKTGYTDLAGGNLGVVFNVGPAHPVVAVVMGSTEDGRFSDMKTLVADTITAVNEGE